MLMLFIIYIISCLFIGAIAGGAFVYLAVYFGNPQATYRNGLVVAALIYVGFSIAYGNLTWIAIEVVGVFIFGFFAWKSRNKAYEWFAAGWALHPLWDIGLHIWGAGRQIAPFWYVIACISFDIVAAVLMFMLIREWRR